MINFGRLCAFFIALMLSFQSWGAIIFDGRFESGVIYPLGTGAPDITVDSGYYAAMSKGCTLLSSIPNNRTYATTNDNRLVTSPVRYGTYANAQTVWRNCDYRSYNGGSLQKPRQEFSPGPYVYTAMGRPNGAQGLSNNVEYWVAFSFYIPSSFVDDPSANPTSLFQLKKYTGGATSDTCCLFDITLRGGTLEGRIKDLYNSTGTALDTDNTHEWPATKNVWHDVVMNFRACTQAQKTGGCVPFFKLYLNENGSTSTAVDFEKSGNANMNSVDGIDGPKVNVYKYAYNCVGFTAQANFSACTANGGTNPTNNPTKVTVYFDELLVGDSTSSLAEIQPFVFGTPGGPGGGISIVGHNAGAPLTASADPVYFTAANSTTQLGVRSVKVCKTGSATECDDMPAVNSNTSGGRYTANAFPTITGDGNIPVTATWTYDNDITRKVLDTEAGPAITSTGGGASNWAASNITTPPAAVARDAVTDYGYVNGGEICNSLEGTAGYHNSPTFTVAEGDVIEVRTTLDSGTGDSAKVQLNCTTAGSTIYQGTLGSLALGTQNAGSGITFDEESHSGVFSQVLKLTYNDNATDVCKLRIGPNTTTAGHCVKALGARIWKNPASTTMTFDTTLARADTTQPDLADCQIGETATAAVFNLGCIQTENTGTFYSVISTSTAAPTLAQVKAGQDHTGVAALWAGSQPATSGTFTTGALNPYVQKCAYFAQTDASANDSVVVAGESCVAAEAEPSTKKFIWSEAAGNAISCYDANTNTFESFTGNMSITISSGDWFAVGDDVTELAYAPAVTFVAGEAELIESDLTFGSINALATGSQGYNYWATNGACRADNAIELTAE